MIIQQQEEVPSKEKCKYEKKEFDPMVERGMKDGDAITFSHEGDQKPGYIPGDVVYKIRMKKDPRFERHNNDLHFKMTISLKEALLGFKKTIKHLDGHKVELSTTDITKPGQVYAIEGEGMPLRDTPSEFGKLYVITTVMFPDTLTDKQRQLVEQDFTGGHHKTKDEL